MADDLKKTGRHDDDRINVDQDHEVGYWAEKLGTTRLHAFQLSKRGGELFCELRGDRVSIAGHTVKYLEGTITVP